jgi:hypothetical protein
LIVTDYTIFERERDMHDYYAEILHRAHNAEPTPQARFRAEFENEPKQRKQAPARRGRAFDIEALVERNIQRIGHFIRVV